MACSRWRRCPGDRASRQRASGTPRHRGGSFSGACARRNHEDRVPSFTINPEKNVWWCHECLRGGNVIELARFVWGYEKHEVAMAAADLLHEFGHPIPERPPSRCRVRRPFWSCSGMFSTTWAVGHPHMASSPPPSRTRFDTPSTRETGRSHQGQGCRCQRRHCDGRRLQWLRGDDYCLRRVR
jgi:hypothetical protein